MLGRLLALIFFALFVSPRGALAAETAADTELSIEQRADDLLSRLTTAEKLGLLQTDSPAVPRLGIPAYYWWNEALHGVARAGTATVFPQAIGLAATFDPGLIGEIAHAVADEGRVKFESASGGKQYFGLTYFTPVVNIARDPRWGRTQETYGEDPFLTSVIARSFIQGIEGPDPDHPEALATLKHFAAYSGPEHGRAIFDARVSAFDLSDTYLSQFERVVRTTPVSSVMTSYNAIDGVPASLDKPLIDGLLRQTWGFSGYVVSDCDAVQTSAAQMARTMPAMLVAAKALLAGVDLDCGDEYRLLAAALKANLITVADINRSVRRLLRARLRLGILGAGGVQQVQVPRWVLDSPDHRALARRAALESIVLLKNSGVLPLNSRMRRLALLGALAADPDALIGDYAGEPSSLYTIEQALRERAQRSGARVQYYRPDQPNAGAGYGNAALVRIARDNDVLIVVAGLSSRQEGEEGAGGDRAAIELPASQAALLQRTATLGRPVVLVLTGGSAYGLKREVDEADGILEAWYAGEEGGAAIASIIFGDAAPSGRLPLTFYAQTTDLPAFDDYAMTGRTYRYFQGQPVFRFGDGLSFTRFRYRDPLMSVDTDRGPALAVTLDNVGPRDGDEVVQVYVSLPVRAGVPIENRHLVGFVRVSVPAGASRRVTVPLGWWALSSVDASGTRAVHSGKFELFVGGGQPGNPSDGVAATLDLDPRFDGRLLRSSDYASGTASVDTATP